MQNTSHASEPKTLDSSRLSRRRSSLRRSRPDAPPRDHEIPTVIYIPCQVVCLNRWSPEGAIPSTIGGGNTATPTSAKEAIFFRQQERRRSASSNVSRCGLQMLLQDVSCKNELNGSQATHSMTKSATSGSQPGDSGSVRVRRRPSTEPPSLPRRQRSSGDLDLASDM